MELEVLKKKLSAFKGEGGRIRNVNDDLLLEVLAAWELWTGTSKSFYSGIGSSSKGMASMIGKAKRLKKRRAFNFLLKKFKLKVLQTQYLPLQLVVTLKCKIKIKLFAFEKLIFLSNI